MLTRHENMSENTRNRIESFVAARSGACRNVRVKPAIAGETSVLLIAAIKRRSQLHNRAVVPLGPKLSKHVCHGLPEDHVEHPAKIGKA